TVPVRVRLDAASSLEELVAEVQSQQVELMAHQHLGLADIQRLAGVGELFDTLTVFENYPIDPKAAAGVAGLRIAGVPGKDATHYPLSIAAMKNGGRLALDLGYATDLFDAPAAEEIGSRILRVFEAVLVGPSVSVGRVDVLSAGERQRVVEEW
ncbi:hypothetical protein ADK60_25000, partial [Streptomyces sp. XY431]|uniref:condensation domain-containing protein n=1 Tax=Streptomyces sp. XY431 TaxID=1415562 RepID=UPI0006C2DF6C